MEKWHTDRLDLSNALWFEGSRVVSPAADLLVGRRNLDPTSAWHQSGFFADDGDQRGQRRA